MTTVISSPQYDALFEQAFAAHWQDVFRFALAWTNDLGGAEEVAQEAYVRLWEGRTRVDWSRPVKPWLFTVARRLANDRFRRLRLRLLPAPKGVTWDESAWVRWLDLKRSLAHLSPVERAALLITAVDGLTAVEAANVLGTSPGAVRAAASRARRKLEED